jgi:phosphatidate phosphatase PAH1
VLRKGMLLAPNPANDQVTAKVQSETEGTIQVLDLQGHVLQIIPLKSGVAEIFTNKMTNGMYLVRHQSTAGQMLSVQKLVIQH